MLSSTAELEWFFKGPHHLELLLRYCCSSFDGAAKASLYTNGAVWKPNGVQASPLRVDVGMMEDPKNAPDFSEVPKW